MIDSGIDTNAVFKSYTGRGRSPIMLALDSRCMNLATALNPFEFINLRLQDDTGDTVLHIAAAMYSQPKFLSSLLMHKDCAELETPNLWDLTPLSLIILFTKAQAVLTTREWRATLTPRHLNPAVNLSRSYQRSPKTEASIHERWVAGSVDQIVENLQFFLPVIQSQPNTWY